VVYALGNWLWDWRPYAVWFHILLGAAYAFHVTLTWQVLGTRQSDLGQEGFFFAGVIIGLGNLVALLFGVSWLTGDVALPTVCRWCGGETVRWVWWAGQLFR
jgi:hypothetical protein